MNRALTARPILLHCESGVGKKVCVGGGAVQVGQKVCGGGAVQVLGRMRIQL